MIEFIETRAFTAASEILMGEDELFDLQVYLAERPEAGVVVRGSGGIRKLRWRGLGRGKRCGLRVIYHWAVRANQIWLLALYGKNARDDVPAHVLRKWREEIADD